MTNLASSGWFSPDCFAPGTWTWAADGNRPRAVIQRAIARSEGRPGALGGTTGFGADGLRWSANHLTVRAMPWSRAMVGSQPYLVATFVISACAATDPVSRFPIGKARRRSRDPNDRLGEVPDRDPVGFPG